MNSKTAKKKTETNENTELDYDLVIIGCGPAGQKAAISASKLGKKCAIIEPKFIGGICTHRGTVPSKTFREAAIHLTNYRLRYMESVHRKAPEMSDLVKRVDWVIKNEVNVIKNQLLDNGIDIIAGWGVFKTKNSINILNEKKLVVNKVTFDKAVIAAGTKPHLRSDIDFTKPNVYYTDVLLTMKELPNSLVIVGGGIIGMEYASIFSILGVNVSVIEKRADVLSLIDREMRANLTHQLDIRKVSMFLSDGVVDVKPDEDNHLITKLESGKSIRSSAIAFCTFRQVCTETLGLDKIGVKVNQRGQIEVNDAFQTNIENIYAAGDVVGHPALASTSFEQGQIAAQRAFGVKGKAISKNLPIGIYTIPEISYIGPTEDELTNDKVPYSIGKSYYKNTSRGAIIGALDGMLKLIFHQHTRKLLAVHIIGEDATELLHTGQAVLELGGTIDYFVEKVFNYPTLAETYKYAAHSGLNRLNDV
jgi:NAD(P) transhydrogenase